MPSTNQNLVKINIFDTTDNFLSHTETSLDETNELVLVGDVAVVIESYVNGFNWYRKWSDGFIEQGGIIDNDVQLETVTLLVPFINTNYTVVTAIEAGGSNVYVANIYSKTKTQVQLKKFYGSSSVAITETVHWIAKGYYK